MVRGSMTGAIVLALMLCSCAAPQAVDMPSRTPDGQDSYGRRALARSYNRLEQVLDRRDRQDELPSFSLNPFTETKNSNEEKIQELVADTLEILELSRVTDLARQHDSLAKKIRSDYDAIARHEREKITAPQDAPWYSLTKTRADHVEAIEDLRRDIARARDSQAVLVRQIEAEFRAGGIDVSREQVQFFLASVSGENALALSAVFSNVKQINQHLADLIRTSGEDALTAKKYYGLHVVLIDILMTGHQQSAARISEQYLPNVQALLAENQTNRRDTQTLLQRTTEPAARASLEANLRAQDVTDRAGKLYAQYLTRQKQRLDQSAKALEGKYDVARNTYRTAKTASTLVGLIQAGDEDLASLRGMELPQMIPFENAELQAKFEEIALRIKEGQ